MFEKIVVYIIFLFLPLTANAQQMEGSVYDNNHRPVAFANVAAITGDSAFITGTVTDSVGAFRLARPSKCALLRISSVGYKTQYATTDRSKKMSILLEPDNVMLGEVVVRNTLPRYHRVHGGYSTDIANTILAKMNNADDVLGMLPRITGSDGNFTIFGKGTPTIYVNGRKITNNAELRQLKTENIRTITVLTNPGPEYDSEISSVIVIKTKRPQGEGISGNIDGKYFQSHKVGYTASTHLNWRSKKWDIFGDFTHNNKYGYSDQELEQVIDGNENTIRETLTGMRREQRSKDINAKAGFNFLPNDSSSLGLEYHIAKGLSGQYGRVHYNDILHVNNRQQENLLYAIDAIPGDGPTHELDTWYQGKFGNISLTFDGTWYRKKSDNETRTRESGFASTQEVNSKRISNSHYVGARLTAEDKLSDNLTVNCGAEYYNSHINQSYFNREEIIPATNNIIKENSLATFCSLDYTIGIFDFSAGLRYEHIENNKFDNGLKNNEESHVYDKLFPNVDISCSLGEMNIGLSYGVTSTKPTYSQLSNIVSYDSRYLYEGGNPVLKMTMEHAFELNAIYKYINASLSYEIDYNPIVQWGQRYDSKSDVVLLTHINIPKVRSLTCTLSAQPVIAFWHPVLELDFQKQYIDALGMPYNFNKPVYQLVFNNIFVFKPELIVQANYLWHSSGADGYGFMGRYQEFNLSLQKTFLKRRLYTKVQLSDIFRSTKTSNEMHASHYNVQSTIFPKCRTFMFTVGLNFNQTRKRYTGGGAAVEEKNRL